jgi:iron complex transport system substrate-binding protein
MDIHRQTNRSAGALLAAHRIVEINARFFESPPIGIHHERKLGKNIDSFARGPGRGFRRSSMGAVFLFLALWISFAAATANAAPTDFLGREVAVPENPQRIVALVPSLTEIIFALGGGDRMVGATRFANHPPEAAELPRVGSYPRPDLERILALEPDLVLATKDGNPPETVHRLDALGVAAYVVNPANLEQLFDTIRRIGGILGASETAEAMIRDFRNRLAAVRDHWRGRDRTRVFMQIGTDPLVTVGGDTFLNELMETAGGENVMADRDAYPMVSVEPVVALRPEVILITTMEQGADFLVAKREWESWPEIPAARNGRIHLVDSDLYDRPSPRTILALEELVKLLHPEPAP